MKKILPIVLAIFLLAGCFDSGEVRLLRPIGGCVVGDHNYAVGVSNVPAGDGCNTCFCGTGNQLVCTQNVCEKTNTTTLANPAAVKCKADGFDYVSRKMEAGEAGFCINAETKAECPDFAYFRGECVLGDVIQKFSATLTGIGGSGVVEKISSESGVKLTGNIHALPELALDGGESYVVWLVRVDPFLAQNLGTLTQGTDQNYELALTSSESLADFMRVVITHQSADATALELPKKVLEGTFERDASEA